MSVITADENLETAREGTDTALKALSEICINECWGHDDYKVEFRADIEKAFDKLREVRELLNG